MNRTLFGRLRLDASVEAASLVREGTGHLVLDQLPPGHRIPGYLD